MNAPFKAECPHCFTTFNLKSRASVGKKVKCKNCGDPFTVKLIGDAAGDDFDDSIEDYGADDYGSLPLSTASLPPAGSSRAKPSKKKAKRKLGTSTPWNPIIITLVVVAVGVGGWIGYQSLPSGGVMSILDSPESVLDDYYQAQYDWVDEMASVKSNEDLEGLKLASEAHRNRVWGLIERMVLLGPISQERAEEVRKYDGELEKLHKSTLRERSQAEVERLQSLNLDKHQLYEALKILDWIPFSEGFAFPTPEPRADHGGDQFQAELDRINRDFAKLIVQIDNLSDAESHLDDVDQLIQRIETLRTRNERGGDASGSPYESRQFMWKVLITEWMSDHEKLLAQDESVEEAYGNLLFAWKSAETQRDEKIASSGLAALKEERRIEDIQRLGAIMRNALIVEDAFEGYDVSSRGLSWRVHLMKYYDTSLYFKFDQKQDWTAPQNQNLQTARPDLFKTRYDTEPTTSSFHLIVGPETAFAPEYGGLRWRNLRDGTSNTAMIVEGGRGTGEVWTRPGGISFNPENPKKNFGEFDGDSFFVMMFDGSVKRVSKDVDNEVLNSMIRPQDGVKPLPGSADTGNASAAKKPTELLKNDSGSELHPGLKRLRTALRDYYDEYQHYPSDSDGLSWRVHLLQHLDPELYSQFDLKSDCNSPQNKKLLDQRPDIFKSQYDTDASSSGFNVFHSGPYSGKQGPRLQDITNGLSNTIMIIEGGRGSERPWTQPGGIGIDFRLGKIDGKDYFALMFDGSIRRIPAGPNHAIEFIEMATGRKHSRGR